ncbi:MAG: trigger factor [Erysipelotrichaceae bacterium]|nr:trigger factor [Erysipelotrichaceae bacterium]
MTTEKLEQSRVKAVFDVTADEFEKALDKAFEKLNANVTIKGFRTGKAPRSAYEKTYGEMSLFDEALNVILNQKAQEIYKDEKLARQICGPFEPNLEGEDRVTRGKDFKVSLSFDVYPEVKLPQYKGLEVKAKVLTATDEEVENAVKNILKKDASKANKEEQVIASGDYAIFDFAGTVDGVAFPGGTAENYELQIGSGQFIPGFEDQMIGMKAGEVKDVNVTFPENYGAADLAGKAAVFKVTVHEVKVESFPELTDEYVQNLKLEGVNTVSELKASKKAEIEAQKAVSEKDRQVDELINKILDNTVVDMPKSLIDDKVNAIRGQYINQAKMYNIPFETFLSLMNIDKNTFEAETLKQGARQALFSVVATKLIEVENLQPSKDALEAKAEADAKASGKTKEAMLKQNLDSYFNQLSYEALINMLLTNAVEVEGEAKPAQKKTTASTQAKKTTASTAAKKTTASTQAKKTTASTAAKKTTASTAAKKTATATKSE